MRKSLPLFYLEVLESAPIISIADVKAGNAPDFFTTKGQILEVSEIREFNQNSGGIRKVRSMGFESDGEQIRLVLWGNVVDTFTFASGDIIIASNVRVKEKEDDGSLEIHSTSGTTFRNADESVEKPESKPATKKMPTLQVGPKKETPEETKGVDFGALNEARVAQGLFFVVFTQVMSDTFVPSI